MQNIDVRFSATSNFAKTKADLAALEAQAVSLNATLSQRAFAQSPAIVDPGRWRQASEAVGRASQVYRNAASSSGLLTTQQIRATSQAEKYTQALQKQKLTFMDMMRHRGIMKQVYQDQLRYQRMTAQYWGTDMAGRAVTDIAIPKNVPQDLNTMRQKMGMFGYEVSSASKQIVNLGKNVQWAGRQLTVGFTYPMVMFGALAGVMAYKVEDAFGSINKVYDYSSKALKNQMVLENEQAQLRTDSMRMATEVAKQYGLTVEKTLAVEQQLAATGLTGDKLMATTKEVQRISALGDIDPTQTTDMVVALQTAFKDTIKDSNDLTNTLNFMNAASNATSLSLQDIAEATPRAASGLAQLGVNAEEMTILLVSMREAGVQAAEGANALKSATTRILNPAIVQKATDMYAEMGAKGLDIGKMADQSQGNLYKFIGLLGKALNANADLTKKQKASGIAALFGTYQFNRLNAALVNVGDAQAGVNNQTKKAIELQNKSNKELADQAKISEEAMMNTPAAKFRQAWANFQIQLSEMGKPFLEAAASILELAGALVESFNKMDDWKKKAIMFGAVIMSIAGPAIMLAGLFMNLVGQFGSGVGALFKFAGNLRLVNKEEQAAAVTAKAQDDAMKQQQKTVSTLTEEIHALAMAYREAAAASKQYSMNPAIPGPKSGEPGFIGPPLPTVAGKTVSMAEWNAYNGISRIQTPGKGSISDATRLQMARNKLAYEQMKANGQYARDATAAERAAAGEYRIRTKMGKVLTSGAVAMGAMGASAGLMMLDINDTTNSIAKWTMIGTLIVPAVSSLVGFTYNAAKAAWAVASAWLVAQKAAFATSVETAKMAGVGTFTATRQAIGARIAANTTGAGVAGGVATAALIAGYLIQKKISAVEDERRKNTEAITSATEKWAEATGVVLKDYKDINLVQGGWSASGDPSKFMDAVNMYSEGGDLSGITDAWKALNTETKKSASIVDQWTDLIVRGKMSAKEASQQMMAMLVASGESYGEAADRVARVTKGLEEMSKWQKLNNQLAKNMEMFDWTDDETIKTSAQRYAQVFAGALAEATPKEVRKMFDELTAMSEDTFSTIFNNLSNDGRTQFELFGVNNMQDFIRAQSEGMNFDYSFMNVSGPMDPKYLKVIEDLQKIKDLDKYLAPALGTTLQIEDAFTGIAGLVDTVAMKLISMNYKDAKEYASQLLDNLAMTPDLLKGKAAKDVLEQINQLNAVRGFEPGKTTYEAWYNLTHRVRETEDAAGDLKKKIDELPDRKEITISAEQAQSVVRDAMAATQEDMAQSALDKFNEEWDDREAALEDRQQKASDRLQKQQEAQQRQFDKRWEQRKNAVQKAYQQRIDAVQREINAEQKADEARQRIFEKEKARLQTLAELENARIDYQTALNEGRLDDAAKALMEGQVASDSAQMDAEQRAAEQRSQKRINALEKKNDRLEKQRDKEIKQLECMEERMRRHLERVQEKRADALEKQQQDEMDAMQATRDYEEAMLEDRLELFKSYTARNQKDLEKWMREVGLSYDDFGSDVRAKGEKWSSYFQESLTRHIRQAGMEVMNDNIWETVGKKITEKLLKGLGFDNKNQFSHFIKTGEMPQNATGRALDKMDSHHGGGIVGTGGSGRGNIPNTYKGLHRTEQIIRAQKGEYVINRKASSRHKAVLDAINSGAMDTNGVMGGLGSIDGMTGNIGGYGGPAAMLAGAMTQMLKVGLGQAYNNLYQKGLKKSQRSGGVYSGTAGMYGGTQWSVEQMKNAAIIAGVGSKMGLGKRDIEIGIMTAITESMLRNVDYGDADSLGLFQQRPSMGWGSAKQVQNPRYAAGKFFAALKQIDDRGAMTPWMVAQSVQRSAFSDGSNYQKWWNEAQAIYTKGLQPGNSISGGFVPGNGRKHRPIRGPVTSGLHGSETGFPAVDLAGATGRPVYAVADGVITKSLDIPGPLPTDDYNGAGPYGSYGRMIQLQTPRGEVLYAHLSRRSVREGQRVSGGSIIGYSGNTGNSSGPHLHFGATNGPYSWLRSGGTIRHDGTQVIAHRGETILDAPLTRQFRDNVANGGGDQYTIAIDMTGAVIRDDVDIEKAVETAMNKFAAKVGRSRTVK